MDGPVLRYMPGERKQQRVRIHGCNPDAQVVVQSATWELHKRGGDCEVIDHGSCIVTDGNLLTILLAIDDPGRYHLLITCVIGPEVYKTTAEVVCNGCN